MTTQGTPQPETASKTEFRKPRRSRHKLLNETEGGLTPQLQYTVSPSLPESLRQVRGSSAQLDFLLRTLKTIWMLSLPTGFDLPVNKLAKHMGVYPASASRHLKTLQKKGLLEVIDKRTVRGEKAKTFVAKGVLLEAILADAKERGACVVRYNLIANAEQAVAAADASVNRVDGEAASVAEVVEALAQDATVLVIADASTEEGFSAVKEVAEVQARCKGRVKLLDLYRVPTLSNIAAAVSETVKGSVKPVHVVLVNPESFAGFYTRSVADLAKDVVALHPNVVISLVEGYRAKEEFAGEELPETYDLLEAV